MSYFSTAVFLNKICTILARSSISRDRLVKQSQEEGGLDN